jgi:HK97 family phage major capsid protein
MEKNEIIAVVEQAIGAALNEEAFGSIIDAKLAEALKPLDKKHVIIGELPDEQMRDKGVTFSQFLGDMAREMAGGSHPKLGRGLKHMKPEQLVFVGDKGEAQTKDLYEGTDSTGGYLVPTEESRELLNLATEQFSVIPGLCRQIPMRINQITFPTLTSGLTGYWVPEATTTLGVTPDGTGQASGEKLRSSIGLGQMAITAHVFAVVVAVSNQLLDDSDPSVDQILRALFAETLGDGFDTACLLGAGSSTDPITGLNSKITTNALQAGAQFNYDDIIDLIFSTLDYDAKSMPVIIGNTKAERVLLKVKDSDNQYIYKSPREGASVPTVWGHNYYRNGNILNTYGTNSDKTRLFLGDFGKHGYAGRRMGVTIMANPYAEPYFSYNQVAFRAEFRVGFNVDAEKYFSKMDGVPTA